MKLLYSYLKELKLSSKSFYFYVELIMTVVLLVVLLYVIPENANTTQTSYLSLNMNQDMQKMYIDQISSEEDVITSQEVLKIDDSEIEVLKIVSGNEEIFLIESKEDLIKIAKDKRPRLAAVVTYDASNKGLLMDYYLQGYESDRLVNFYKIINTNDFSVVEEKLEDYEVKVLEEDYEPLNTREMALPSLITFNGSLMGLFIMAAYIFLDKQEGVIKAYAVTASKVWHYLLSKALVLMTTTLISTMIITIPVMKGNANYLMMIVLLLCSSFFAAVLGLLISSFFDNMNQAFGAIYTVMMLFMLPAIAYFIPSWQPLWIRLIPIHYLIQGFKETIISNGDIGFVLTTSASFLIAGIVLFLLSNIKFKRTLAR